MQNVSALKTACNTLFLNLNVVSELSNQQLMFCLGRYSRSSSELNTLHYRVSTYIDEKRLVFKSRLFFETSLDLKVKIGCLLKQI